MMMIEEAEGFAWSRSRHVRGIFAAKSRSDYSKNKDAVPGMDAAEEDIVLAAKVLVQIRAEHSSSSSNIRGEGNADQDADGATHHSNTKVVKPKDDDCSVYRRRFRRRRRFRSIVGIYAKTKPL